jgi:hypothetical protein
MYIVPPHPHYVELLPLPKHTSSPPMFSEDRVAQSLVFCVIFCRSLFVHLSFLFCSLRCLSFFYLWLLRFVCPSIYGCWDLSVLLRYTVSELCLSFDLWLLSFVCPSSINVFWSHLWYLQLTSSDHTCDIFN